MARLVGAHRDSLKVGLFGSWRKPGLPPEAEEWAYGLGHAIGDGNHLLVTGGSGGIALSARRGCRSAGGLNVGILPEAQSIKGSRRSLVDIAVPTGMGPLGRMAILVQTVDMAFAVGGGGGTMVEVLLTYLQHKLVVIVEGLQRPGDPVIDRIVGQLRVEKIDGLAVRRGYLDSKRGDSIIPVLLCPKSIPPARALSLARLVASKQADRRHNRRPPHTVDE